MICNYIIGLILRFLYTDFQLGERGSGYGSKAEVQDFHKLRQECLSEGRLFEDPDFLPVDGSLYFSQRPDRRFQWLRPHVSKCFLY